MNDPSRSSLELLYHVSRELSSMLDLPTLLQRVLTLSVDSVGAERATLIILDAQLKPLDAAIIYNQQYIPDTTRQLQATLDQGLAGWVLRHRQPALITNTGQDERWLRRPDDTQPRGGEKSVVCVLLTVRDQPVGVLTMVHSVPGFFNEEHLALLQSIADLAGVAVHNARLYTSVEIATRRYHELFEDSIDSILISDLSGVIMEANRQALHTLGYPSVGLLGRNIGEVHPVQWDLFGSRLELLDAARTISYESALRCWNGEILPVQVYVRKVILENEFMLQWTLRDISERKRMAAMQEDLTSMVYHDLRSPLANIISSMDMLETFLPSANEAAPARSVFAILKRSTERMQRLVNSLLDIHRLEDGQPISNQQAVSLADLLRDCVEIVTPGAESKNQEIQAVVPSDFPNLWIDPDMIRRVLINLLENAVKFTPLHGKIQVGGKLEEDWAVLWVQDSGPGIPAEARERIFEKFVRLQSGPGIPKGVGLGLSFCRLAVEAHGGSIWVENKPGGGSSFQFRLPLAHNLDELSL